MPIALAPFLLILLVGASLLVAITVLMMARLLVRPPRMTDGRATYILQRISPTDLALAYEDVSFKVRDEATGGMLRLAGWWIRHPQAHGRCVLLTHGYADAKVGAIAWAPLFHELGWNILAIDLRAHGYSEGKFCTGGCHERHDLAHVVQQARDERPVETRCFALFGASMGAVASAGAVALLEEQGDQVAGVIMDCPFADLRRAAVLQYGVLGLPRGLPARAAVRLAERMSGASFAAVRPVEWVSQLHCPVMVIQSARDPLVPPDDARAIEAATRSRPQNVFWRVEEAGHMMGLVADQAEYARRVGEFLSGLCGRINCEETTGRA